MSILAPDVAGGRRADAEGMRNVIRIGAVVAAIVLLNVALHFVPFPDVSLDVPGWIHTVVKVKNWLLLAFFVAVIVGIAVEEHRRKRD
jgi:hypothetical protein